nr:MAG TPA: hypothetical protein [Caudoviricetes sp.]
MIIWIFYKLKVNSMQKTIKHLISNSYVGKYYIHIILYDP